MVRFMLGDPGLPAGEPLSVRLPFRCQVREFDLPVPGDDGLVPADGQTPFIEGSRLRPHGPIAGVQYSKELEWLPVPGSGRRRVDGVLVLQDSHPQGNTELRRSKANTGCSVHDLTHPGNESSKFGRVELAIEGSGQLPENGVAGLDDWWHGLSVQNAADGVPDPDRSEISGRGCCTGIGKMGHGSSLRARGIGS